MLIEKSYFTFVEKKAALQETDLKSSAAAAATAATAAAATTTTTTTAQATAAAAAAGGAAAVGGPLAGLPADMVACEQCGKPEHRSKLKRKRYCSPGCARLAKTSNNNSNSSSNNLNSSNNNANSNNNSNGSGIGMVGVDAMALADKLDESLAEEKMQTDALSPEPGMIIAELPATATVTIAAAAVTALPATAAATPSSSSSSNIAIAVAPISSWSVDEVSEFIRKLPGCQDYVDDFVQQEIDGQALLLLKENHLVNAMGMKLGPALKIVAKVESMKEVNLPAVNDASKDAQQ